MRTALQTAWSWTGDHATAGGVMVAVPAFAVLLTIREAGDWFTGGLTVAAGLCWVGVLLPTAVREPVVLVSSGIAAVCGALVSIIFSRTLDSGRPDQAFTPLFFALLAAGSASVYGQHCATVERRRTDRDLAAALIRLEEMQCELRESQLEAVEVKMCDRCATQRPPRHKWWWSRPYH